MSSVDQRVVEMKFNSTAFAKGIADTLAALTRLQDGLKLNGASQGAEQAAQGLNELGNQTGVLGGKFSAMQAVAFGALASIGAKAVQTGQQVISSLTIDPVMQGFKEYETNMNSIQTILANTSAAGTGLPEVNAALDELNHYSDQTIYNFSEMARNIGTFTAAGVDLKTATGAIKGIANLAAVSGSNSQQAAGAMYQLSQAISAGRVSLMDWNSVVNAGMGGTVFQRALAQTAVAMGTLDDSTVTLTGDMQNVSIAGKSFRDSIDATNGPSWLTSDVLTQTLNQFTGDLTNAELAAKGYTEEQIKAIQTQADMAKKAATEVKTLSGLMDTLKEGVASGWSTTFRLLVGDFEEAKTLFTNISDSVGGFLGGMADRRNELLAEWKLAGGRDILLAGLKEAAYALKGVIEPLGQAFRQIFPATTAEQLLAATKAFRGFMMDLKPGPETIDRLRRTFAGLFAIVGIVWELLKAGVKFFADLFGEVTEGSGGILKFTANIGDFLVALHSAIKSGDVFGKIFDKLAVLIQVPIEAIRSLVGWITSLFTGGEADNSALTNSMEEVGEAGDRIGAILQRFAKVLENVKDRIGDFVDGVREKFSEMGKVFQGNGWEFNADTIMKALGIAGGAGIGVLLIKALTGIKNAISNFDILGGRGEGFFQGIQDALGGLTDTLSAMQANLKANALLKIAAAIALLAAAVFVLAGIDAEGLIRATAALTAMFIQLGAAMAVFSKIGTVREMVKITVMGFALMFLAAAILILTVAVKRLADLDWDELGRGLAGVTALLAGLAGAARLMASENQAMIKTGAALLLVAVAVRILVSAVEDLAQLGWEDLGKGIGGVAVLLGALGLFSRFAEANKAGLSNGLGILMLAVAIKVLASAVGDFAQYNWEELGQGMAGIGAGLALIAGAMWLIPADGGLSKGLGVLAIAFAMKILAQAVGEFAELSWGDMAKGLIAMNFALGAIVNALERLESDGVLKKAVGLVIVAAALKIVASALEDMGSIPFGDLVKGLLALTVSLGVIAIALNIMQGTVSGAFALLIVSAALAVLAQVLKTIGSMSWPDLLAGLAGLAGVLIILGVAALVLAPLAPVLLIIGAAIGLLGIGVVLAAAGVMLFAMALTALAAAGAAGVMAVKAILLMFISLIPVIMAAVAAGIIAFAVVIGEGAPALIGAFVAVLTALLQAIIDITPKIAETMLVLLQALLQVIIAAVPMMIEAGMTILIAFLRGIADNIGEVITTAVDIIVNFLNGITNNLGRIITAGADLIIAFMDGLAQEIPRVVDAAFNMVIDIANGIADSIRQRLPELMDAGWNIVDAIIDGIIDGVTGLAGKAWTAVTDFASGLLDGAKDFLGINSPSKAFRDQVGKPIVQGVVQGLAENGYLADRAAVSMGRSVLDTMGKTISGLGGLINENMDDLNPVISPVLDLSAVQRDSARIGDILGAAPIDLRGATASASDASAGYAANLEALAEAVAANSGMTNNFTQNNYSPKALSQADIYRNTNNQISRAKGALTNAN